MPMEYALKLPVKPHVRKFILYYNDWEEPVRLRLKSFPGHQLFPLMQKDIRYASRVKHTHERELITFLIPEHYAWKFGCNISDDGIAVFNNIMDALFRQELFARIHGARQISTHHGVQRKVIRAFREEFRITEDDFSYDNFKKIIYRHRKKKNQRSVRLLFRKI